MAEAITFRAKEKYYTFSNMAYIYLSLFKRYMVNRAGNRWWPFY